MKKSKPQSKIQNYLLLIILGVLILFFVVKPVSAGFFFEAPAPEIANGSDFEVKVLVDSQNQNINAFEGNIVFPKDYLTLKSINDNNSLISLWLNRPQLRIDDYNKVFFSGIIPGGYNGEGGYLFSLIFTTRQTGEIKIYSNNDKILINDGLGTSLATNQSPLLLKISDQVPQQNYITPPDQELPETFIPLISRDLNLFNNKWFLVFTTQDKASGIDHYEVAERRELKIFNFRLGFGDYLVADSPYLLRDQGLKSNIYVKAVDKSGNEQIAVVLAPNSLKWYENYWFWFIIILIITIIFILGIKITRKSKK